MSNSRSAMRDGSSHSEEGQVPGGKIGAEFQSEDLRGSEIKFAKMEFSLTGSNADLESRGLAGPKFDDGLQAADQASQQLLDDTAGQSVPGETEGADIASALDAATNPASSVAVTLASSTASVLGQPGNGADRYSGTAGLAALTTGAEVAKSKSPVKNEVAMVLAGASNDADAAEVQLGKVVSDVVTSRKPQATPSELAHNNASGTQTAAAAAATATAMATTAAATSAPATSAAAALVAMANPQKNLGGSENASARMPEGLKELMSKPLDGDGAATRLEKELPRMAANQRSSLEGQGDAIRSERENLLAASRTGDTAGLKPVNDLSLGNLGQPSQTLISAVKENTNWSRMLSAPNVHFTETMKPNGKVLQALNVTLNPVELGKLELNLRMQQGQVTIEVRAESDQAYRALLVDQDALANNLRGLGFKVDAITINGPQSENGPQFQSSTQSEDGGASDTFESGSSDKDGQHADDSGYQSNDPANGDEEDTASLNII
ncbi:MAG: flagellar hook-length control protein FliK [Rhizobiaceae bacterium]